MSIMENIRNFLSGASGRLKVDADASRAIVDSAVQHSRDAAVRVIRSNRRDVEASHSVILTANSALSVLRRSGDL